MSEISINQQIEEVERELAMRKKVYPDMIARRKLRQSEADYFVKRLKAVRETLVWFRDNRDDCLEFVRSRRATE